MNDRPGDQLEFLEEMLRARAEVSGEIVQIGAGTWAIHGSIPVDGEVLVARYDSREHARRVLAQLRPNHVDRSTA